MSSIATKVPRTQPPSVRPRSEKSSAPPARACSGSNQREARSLSALISQKMLIVTTSTMLSKAPKTPPRQREWELQQRRNHPLQGGERLPGERVDRLAQRSLASNACCTSFNHACACAR